MEPTLSPTSSEDTFSEFDIQNNYEWLYTLLKWFGVEKNMTSTVSTKFPSHLNDEFEHKLYSFSVSWIHNDFKIEIENV